MDGRGGRGAVLQFCASGRWDRIGVEVVVVMLLEYPMRWERVGVLSANTIGVVDTVTYGTGVLVD